MRCFLERKIDDENRITENGDFIVTKEELKEYDGLIKKTNDKTHNGEPIKLSPDESKRLIELARLIKHRKTTKQANVEQIPYLQATLLLHPTKLRTVNS